MKLPHYKGQKIRKRAKMIVDITLKTEARGLRDILNFTPGNQG
jgi:hypothetical protein